MNSEFEKEATVNMIQVGKDRVDKIRCLYYEPKVQTKQTIVLIPGYNSIPSAWDEFLNAVKDSYRVFVIETREKFTAELGKNADFSLDRTTMDIVEVIDYLSIEDYILVTSSMGGAFSLYGMSKGWIKPTVSFLVGPVLKVEIPKWSWIFVYISYPFVFKILIKPLTKWYMKRHYERDQALKYSHYLDLINVSRVRKSMLTLKKFRIDKEDLEKIESKCILIGAEKDKLHQSETTRWIKETIKDAEYYDLESNVRAHGTALAELMNNILKKINVRD